DSSGEAILKDRPASEQKTAVLDSSLNAQFMEIASVRRISSAKRGSRSYKKKRDTIKRMVSLGQLYLKQGQYAKAMNILKLALVECNQSYAPDLYWEIRCQIGKVYYNTGDISHALNQYYKALYYYEKVNTYNKIAEIKSNIGVVFHRQKDYDQAISYYREGFDALQKAFKPNKEVEARLQTNIGLAYNAKGQYDKAASHYLKSMTINKY